LSVRESVVAAVQRALGLRDVVKVESMDAVLAELAAAGIHPDEPPVSPDGSNEFRTAWITDPDGNRIELVQWPPDHPDGMTAADFANA
jgi:lactoylglutathione lyase